MIHFYQNKRRWWAQLFFLIIAYLLSRFNNLDRELASEEGFFLIPGRNFFEHRGYFARFGEFLNTTDHVNPFHKPPLASLFLGVFSFLSHDGIAGARLVPFLSGLFVCLLPFCVTSSWQPSVIVLVAPFFYAASSHMQTDPTVGLVGYSLVLIYWVSIFQGRRNIFPLLLGASFLWLGKIEIAIIAGAASVATILLIDKKTRKHALKDVAVCNFFGLVLFTMCSWLLGLTAGFPFRKSVFEVFGTIFRISAGLKFSFGTLLELLGIIRDQCGISLFFITLIPIVVGSIFFSSRYNSNARKLQLSMVLFSFVPLVVYLKGGYVGDGFPRYFLVVFPSLFLAAGFALSNMDSKLRWATTAVIMTLAVALLLPLTLRLWKQPGNVTVQRYQYGLAQAVATLIERTKSGDRVFGVERAIWYARDRKWTIVEGYEPYPEFHEAALKVAPLAAGGIFLKGQVADSRFFPITGQIVDILRQRNFVLYDVGDYLVFARPK
ncbi:MAG: hypothetical protein P4M08_06115 [Oligoflexia bacterium]|nr:hypothetical protein [Oligoflexia bacterium]